MPTPKTKAIAAIEERMQQVAPGSYRHQVLTAALDFKTAWIELGSLLTRVRDGALYQEWGYGDFESYCHKELQIRKATAHKLTATYAFMERREPGMVERAIASPEVRAQLPSFDVISVLSRAEESGQIGDREYATVREQVFEEPGTTPAKLTRVLNQNWPPPPPPEPPAEVRLRRLARAARRLADDASRASGVPTAVRERARALAEDFEELVAERAA